MVNKKDLDKNCNSESPLTDADEYQFGKPQDVSPELKDKNTREIIHELRVNQVELKIRNEELEMRNEELKIALGVSRDNYQDLYDFIPVGYFTMTPKGLIKEVNLSVANLLGMTRQKLIENGFEQFVDPESLEQWDNHIITVLGNKDKQSCDITLNKADGSTFYTHLQSIQMAASAENQAADGETHAIRMAVTDITERKRSEEKIKLNESRLQSLHEMSQYRAKNVQELLTFTLGHAIKLTGSKVGYMYHYDDSNQRFILNTWTKDAMDQRDVAEPQDVYKLEETGQWGEAAQQKKPVIVNDFQSYNPLEKGYPPGYGHVEFFKVLTVPVFQNDKVVAVLVVANKESDYKDSDIIQLSLLMDSVWRMVGSMRAQDREQLLVAAIEHAAEGVIITDATGIIQYVNSAEEAIAGYSSGELVGQKTSILKSGKHDDNFYKNLWETINAGKVWLGRFVNKKKDGTEYHEEATISPVYDKSGNLTNFVAVKHDITKQIELQEQLFQAQKMEAIGTLAGGFAHDFNNKLQVISGYVDVILFNKDLSETLKHDLGIIRKAVDSSSELINGMMAFSRKTPVELQAIDLNKLVGQTMSVLTRSIPKMIEIDLLLADDLWPINAAPNQIDQLLTNLAVNARDAMPDGGKLTIKTQNITLDEKYCRLNPLTKPGRYALITVSDTGTGMNKETVSHIFEPFFTTKESGKGTGLGLSIVYGIVEQHGGRIICDSEPSVGTTFRVYFPSIEAVPEEQYSEKKEPPTGQGETILLVDDEPNILEIVSRQLTGYNYKIITSSNGKEALELYENHRDQINLIILDLIMPKMSGEECLRALLKIDPTVRVLVASGAQMMGMEEELKQAGAKGLIKKPFDMSRMLERLFCRSSIKFTKWLFLFQHSVQNYDQLPNASH